MSDVAEVTMARPPAEPLRPFVDSYLGDRLSGFPPGLHRGLPSRNLTFIVSIGPTIDVVAQTDPTEGPRSYRCVLGGLQASSALIAFSAGMIVTVLAALSPSRKAAKVPPVAAMREVAVGSTGYGSWQRIVVGFVILGLGLASLLYGLILADKVYEARIFPSAVRATTSATRMLWRWRRSGVRTAASRAQCAVNRDMDVHRTAWPHGSRLRGAREPYQCAHSRL